MHHSAPSQSHFRKSHPPAIYMILLRGYFGDITPQSSQLTYPGPPVPSAPSITRTGTPFSRIFSRSRDAVTGSTATIWGENCDARMQNAPTFAPMSITRSEGCMSLNLYSRFNDIHPSD